MGLLEIRFSKRHEICLPELLLAAQGEYVPWSYSFVCCNIQGGSNMTRTDLYVNKPLCAAAVRP